MVDRVQPLKIEAPDSGGSDLDVFPVATDRNQDYLDCRGIAVQDDSSNDEDVVISRDASGNLIFKDQHNLVEKTLSDLLAGGSAFDPDKILTSVNGDVLVNADGNVLLSG